MDSRIRRAHRLEVISNMPLRFLSCLYTTSRASTKNSRVSGSVGRRWRWNKMSFTANCEDGTRVAVLLCSSCKDGLEVRASCCKMWLMQSQDEERTALDGGVGERNILWAWSWKSRSAHKHPNLRSWEIGWVLAQSGVWGEVLEITKSGFIVDRSGKSWKTDSDGNVEEVVEL